MAAALKGKARGRPLPANGFVAKDDVSIDQIPGALKASLPPA